MRHRRFTDEMIIEAIHDAGTARGAARLLGCSPAYIHQFVGKRENRKHRIWGRQGIDASKQHKRRKR